MTREELLQYFKDNTTAMIETMQRKNADYSGDNEDPFFNFSAVELMGICKTEQGFMTRITDKYLRIISFVKKGVLQVKEETVEDTLVDLANYCLLLAAYIRSKRA